MPHYEPPNDAELRMAVARSKGIDFSDTLFVLSCGCIPDGCSGAAGLDRFVQGKKTRMWCDQHENVLLKQIVTVGDIDGRRGTTE